MANEKHLYAVFGGSYTADENKSETWQIGVRFVLNFGDTAITDPLPNNWSVIPDNRSDTSDGWARTSLFTASGPPSSSFDPFDWLHDQLEPAAEDFFGSDAMASAATLERIKVSPINSSGHVIDLRTAYSVRTTPLAGGEGGGLLPLQNSVVVSTRTGQPGRKGRGRFYMPAMSPNMLAGDSRLAGATRTTIAEGAAAFLVACAVDIDTPNDIQVKPIVTGDPYTVYNVIESIRVGDVVDTQRRRRKSLVESFLSEAVDL